MLGPEQPQIPMFRECAMVLLYGMIFLIRRDEACIGKDESLEQYYTLYHANDNEKRVWIITLESHLRLIMAWYLCCNKTSTSGSHRPEVTVIPQTASSPSHPSQQSSQSIPTNHPVSPHHNYPYST